jgi:hypothetical protein
MLDDDTEYSNSLTDLYEIFPFFRSFPFEYYDLELDKNAVSNESSLLDPVVIKAGGGFVEPHLVHFKYSSEESDIVLSFYTYDIKYIVENESKIKKMDDLVKSLFRALNSNNIIEKLKVIKEGEKSLLKKIGSGLLYADVFDKILEQMNETSETKISKSSLKIIKSLSFKIEQCDFSKDQLDLICGYYDMHLHHINIILGTIIATKIHP